MAIVNKSRSSRLEMLHKNIYSENFGSWSDHVLTKLVLLKKDFTAIASLGILQNLKNSHSVACEQLLLL